MLVSKSFAELADIAQLGNRIACPKAAGPFPSLFDLFNTLKPSASAQKRPSLAQIFHKEHQSFGALNRD